MAEQLDLLISSAAAFPARTLAPPDLAEASKANAAGCGFKCDESCPRCGRLGSLLKTSLLSAVEAQTGCSATWKRSATPSGRSWWVLTISARRTGASACGSSGDPWPTPTASAYGSSNNGCPGDGRAEYATKGNPSLATLAKEWQTPTASLASAGSRSRSGERKGELLLTGQALQKWPTPTAGDAKASGSRITEDSNAHPGISLTDAAVHGLTTQHVAQRRMWATPTARDWKDSAGQACNDADHQHCDLLPRHVFSGLPVAESLNESGSDPESSPALNCDWVFQLMGYPATWARLSTARASRPPATP